MKTLIRNTVGKFLLKAASAAWVATLPLETAAQQAPADVDELIEYAQCIRANDYPDFPDPGPNGMQFRITPGTADKFQAAQRACTDKLPSGMAAMNEPPNPERLDALVKFAACVRASGVADFPDPTPQGRFEILRGLDMRSPQAQQALQTCRESNPLGGLSILVGG